MGEVYRAHDVKLGRDVALKILPRQLADDADRRARMMREARAAASLNHPGICTIHDVGEADGQIYIAMEVIEGQSLSARLAERSLPFDEILRITLQLTDAVAHAHDRGIVHRDLKAANVMITPEGRVKVLDFGLAKRVAGEEFSEETTFSAAPLTEPQTIVGTLPYMSPEQLRGDAADVRSDVWALGVMLYEMAAGARPFSGRTGFELSSAILHEAPSPLSPRVPPALGRVISRCLEKEPARRYQRAGEVGAALASLPVDARFDVRPWAVAATRRPWVLAVAGLVGIFALAAIVWRTNASRDQGPPGSAGQRIQSIAVLPLDNLSGNSGEDYFVTGMHEALITDLARIGLQKVIAKPSADAYKGTKKPLRQIGQELGVEGLVTGSIVRAGGRLQITMQLVNADTGVIVWANRYEGNAGDVLSLQNEVVVAIAREVQATLTADETARLTTARPVNAAAHDAYLKSRSMLAAFNASNMDRKAFDAATRQLEQTIQLDPAYAPSYVVLSLTYLTASQTSLLPPRETFPRVRAAAVKAVELDDTLADAHAALAEASLWYEWDWTATEREIQRALTLNPDSTDALRARQTYLTLVPGRFEEASRTSQRIVTLDPLNPFSRVQPIWVAFYSRRHDESIRHAHTLREVAPNNIMGPYFLAANYGVKQMRAEVDAECGRVMDLLSGAYVMRPLAQCAWAYATVGQTDEARRLVRRLEQPPAGVWLDPASMSQVYAALGDTNRAMDWLKKGLEESSPLMIYLKASAFWDPIRVDPRFQAMLRQMNFPQ
jgi:serine/threonine-protein kinase